MKKLFMSAVTCAVIFFGACGGKNTELMSHISKEDIWERYKKESDFYTKSCDANSALACFNLGVLYEIGLGVKQDFLKAREFYKKACDMNDGEACYNLGILYRDGEGVKRDTKKSEELYRRSCSLSYKNACNIMKSLH